MSAAIAINRGFTPRLIWAASQRGINVTGAAIMTGGLLFMMTQLISNELPPLEEEIRIPIPRIQYVEEQVEVQTVTPKRPVLKERPKKEQVNYPIKGSDKQVISPLYTELHFTPTKEMTGLPGGGTLVPISPSYPVEAAQRGLCGEVLVQFDVNELGQPINIAVLESSHRAFNRSAKQAVSRARYKPSIEGGEAVMVMAKQEKITYVLEDGC